jgi:hypothetical protein
MKDAVTSSRWRLVTDIVQAHSTRTLVPVDTLESFFFEPGIFITYVLTNQQQPLQQCDQE